MEVGEGLGQPIPPQSTVTSVFGRTGAVTAQTGDYTVAQVTGAVAVAQDIGGTAAAPKIIGLQGASISATAPTTNQGLVFNGTLWLPAAIANSVFGRTGAVVATAGDYTAAEVTNALDLSDASLQTTSGPLKVTGDITSGGGSFKLINGSDTAEVSTDASGNVFISTGAAGAGIYLRPGGVGSNDGLCLALGGGVFQTYNSAGAVRNILDDGSGDGSVTRNFTTTQTNIAAQWKTTGQSQDTLTVASGTALQADANFDADLYIPITYTPTAGAAATMAVAMGTTNTPPTLFTEEEPAGTALDSVNHMTYLRVPAGWYFELTLTNATFTAGASNNVIRVH